MTREQETLLGRMLTWGVLPAGTVHEICEDREPLFRKGWITTIWHEDRELVGYGITQAGRDAYNAWTSPLTLKAGQYCDL